jgi:hypothetical protein
MTREDDPLGAKCDSLGMQREMRSGALTCLAQPFAIGGERSSQFGFRVGLLD